MTNPGPASAHSTQRGLALVFTGGDRPLHDVLDGLARPVLTIAADSGLEHALALGCPVDLVVGDLDSADPAAVTRAERDGATVERHPADKDATDLELAIAAAQARGVAEVVVIGGGGGRLDHLLANALLLAAPAFADLDVRARIGTADLSVVRTTTSLPGRPGDLCSLLALGGAAVGVRTGGLRFPLHGETLHPGSTRGVSNQLTHSDASVSLDGGVLLAVLPEARRTP